MLSKHITYNIEDSLNVYFDPYLYGHTVSISRIGDDLYRMSVTQGIRTWSVASSARGLLACVRSCSDFDDKDVSNLVAYLARLEDKEYEKTRSSSSSSSSQVVQTSTAPSAAAAPSAEKSLVTSSSSLQVDQSLAVLSSAAVDVEKKVTVLSSTVQTHVTAIATTLSAIQDTLEDTSTRCDVLDEAVVDLEQALKDKTDLIEAQQRELAALKKLMEDQFAEHDRQMEQLTCQMNTVLKQVSPATDDAAAAKDNNSVANTPENGPFA